MTVKIELGTLIHGTLRNEDLLPMFTEHLNRIRDFGKHQDLVGEARTFLNITSGEFILDREQETASEIVNDLMDALNEYAPNGYYFGSIEGDGSDFGFWADEDPDEDIATGKCNQCDSATINGVYCHEQGCPNS